MYNDYHNQNDFWQNRFYPEMDDGTRWETGCLHMLVTLAMMAIGLLICFFLDSCTTTKYVPVPEYHTDTLTVVQHHRDSIYFSDSIYISDFARNDTVFRISDRWHTRFIQHEVHDTIREQSRDSVILTYPVEVIREVPQPLTWWQRVLMWLGGVCIGMFLLWMWRTK